MLNLAVKKEEITYDAGKRRSTPATGTGYELSWQDAQRRQAELTALSQAVMLLIGGIAVVAMLWLASDGVGGKRAAIAPALDNRFYIQ
ncbi:hypothetical protein FK521_28665, partial [Klebsiella pneumoniae]|nr:hypothetical protein [Klebsiella pneumoniae]